MKTIFLDNQQYIHIFEKKTNTYVDHFNKIAASNKFTLIANLDNLVEFSASISIEDAYQLSSAFHKIQTKWLKPFYDIQQDELEIFIKTHTTNETKPVSYSPIVSFSELIENNQITIESLIKQASSPTEKIAFREKFEEHKDVLHQLKENGPLTSEQFLSSIANYFALRIYNLHKNGKLKGFNYLQLSNLCTYLVENHKRVYKECLSIGSENHLSDIRAKDKTRVTKASDSIDYTSSIAAIPYVDIFVTNDGFLFECLKYVKNKMKLHTTIVKNIMDVPL